MRRLRKITVRSNAQGLFLDAPPRPRDRWVAARLQGAEALLKHLIHDLRFTTCVAPALYRQTVSRAAALRAPVEAGGRDGTRAKSLKGRRERRERFTTTSDIEIADLYTGADSAALAAAPPLGRRRVRRSVADLDRDRIAPDWQQHLSTSVADLSSWSAAVGAAHLAASTRAIGQRSEETSKSE